MNSYNPAFRPGWKDDLPVCAQAKGPGGVKACDEYPFYSSAQAGTNASLRVVNGGVNSGTGSKYRWFAKKCHLISGGQDRLQQGANGTPFLVLPVLTQDSITTHTCLTTPNGP